MVSAHGQKARDPEAITNIQDPRISRNKLPSRLPRIALKRAAAKNGATPMVGFDPELRNPDEEHDRGPEGRYSARETRDAEQEAETRDATRKPRWDYVLRHGTTCCGTELRVAARDVLRHGTCAAARDMCCGTGHVLRHKGNASREMKGEMQAETRDSSRDTN